MTVIPCEQDPRLRAEIELFAEVLKTQAHKLGSHGLDEASFYSSPIFRGAIEKVRGEFSATMRGKREFVQQVLNHMEDRGFHCRMGSYSSQGAQRLLRPAQQRRSRCHRLEGMSGRGEYE
jgi:hypothetical protein